MIPIDAAHPDQTRISKLGAAILAGALVAFPTETVYGLGADATNADAVAAIFTAKERPNTDPLIVHIADISQLSLVTGHTLAELPENVAKLVTRFWPGPLTLVLPRGPAIPNGVTAGLTTVGVRLPAHPIARALIAAAGVPIAAPSANRFGHTSPTTAAHVFADLGDRIPWIIDGGPSQVGIESTILDMTVTPPRLLRPGGVLLEEIEAALGMPVAYQERSVTSAAATAQAPGLLLSHYAPRARLLVFEGADIAATWERAVSEVAALAVRGERVGVLSLDTLAGRFRTAGAIAIAPLGTGDNTASVAHQLFAGLRALDDAEVSTIVCGAFDPMGLGLAIRDRLWRAAGGVVISVDAPAASDEAREA
ncbi:MAG: threonylcarbamoyl-AMP synthase [Ktedonobacterales bacterium]|nr:threonylcarbamoyl-AMP synthase [Ktedonobacterales bacterium]